MPVGAVPIAVEFLFLSSLSLFHISTSSNSTDLAAGVLALDRLAPSPTALGSRLTSDPRKQPPSLPLPSDSERAVVVLFSLVSLVFYLLSALLLWRPRSPDLRERGVGKILKRGV